MKYWFIVHDIEAFNEGLKRNGSNTIEYYVAKKQRARAS